MFGLVMTRRYAPIPLEYVRHYERLVREDFASNLLSGICPQKAEAMNLCEGKVGRPSHLLYVKRFYNMWTEW